ncbi:MAG: ECF transporter S component [Oscillospiraceae bacterium]|nr:ECF transporter S component [Oscillospiraceae bacterium]
MNKNKASKQIADLTKMALLSAIIVLLAFTPLGYIPLGVVNATTIHIPVILGSILLGPKRGAVLGGVFGLTSLSQATITPIVTNFVFTPFYSVGEVHGNFWSLVVCFVPRILTGVVPYLVYSALKKVLKKDGVAVAAAAFAGSMTNTLLVMNFIYLFFGRPYAEAVSIVFDALYAAIIGVILANGIPEAILACLIVVLVYRALKAAFSRTASY